MKTKVLLLQETISDYNIPLYEVLASHIDLTIGYTKLNDSISLQNFKIVKLKYNSFFGLHFINKDLKKIYNEFDVVIFMADMHYFSFVILPFKVRRSFKVIAWTIGLRASYTTKYDVYRKKNILDLVYLQILKRSDAIIIYSKEPKIFWRNLINERKFFVANNSLQVDNKKIIPGIIKNKILFIGTLYKEKNIDELIDSFIEAKRKYNKEDFFILEIIGEGSEYTRLKNFIITNNLSNSIRLNGSIFNEIDLVSFFNESIICVSPNQAGLSVLKSMGYGVPFVTRHNSITGGERNNIINGVNGLFYSSKSELVDILLDCKKNHDKYLKMGEEAMKYYNNNATIEIMAKGFLDAINFSLQKYPK